MLASALTRWFTTTVSREARFAFTAASAVIIQSSSKTTGRDSVICKRKGPEKCRKDKRVKWSDDFKTR
jgi:hypothetical protein